MQQLAHFSPTRSVPLRALCALAAALIAALLGWAPPAAAHDELVSSDPAEAAVVGALPSRAVLTVSGQISEVHQITVTGPDGSVVNGEPTFTGPEVRQNLWAGPDGQYVMTYDVVSADGHDIQGEIHFEVGSISGPSNGGSPVSDVPTSGPGWWERGGDVILPAALVVLAGAATLVLVRRKRFRRSS